MKKPIYLVFFLCLSIIIISVLFPAESFSQPIRQGEWKDHLSYRDGIRLAKAQDWIYCAASTGLVSYNKETGAIRKHSKVTGLSDVLISSIAYSADYNYLVVGYKNGNIDLIKEGVSPKNVPDIKRRIMTSEKSINRIVINNRLAYLACGFGIAVLDLEKVEIRETYFLGANGSFLKINDIEIKNNVLFAATKEGIFYADLTSANLLDYASWSHMDHIPEANSDYKHIENYKNNLFAVYRNPVSGYDQIITLTETGYQPWTTYADTAVNDISSVNGYLLIGNNKKGYLYQDNSMLREIPVTNINHSIIDDDQSIYVANSYSGFVSFLPDNSMRFFIINGTRFNDVARVTAKDDKIWVSSGGPFRLYNPRAFYTYVGGQWENHSDETYEIMSSFGSTDRILVDPRDKSHYFVSSYHFGILEYRGNEIINTYTVDNVDAFSRINNVVKIRASGMQFDRDGNLWVVLDLVTSPIFKLDKDGKWTNVEIFNPIFARNTTYSDMLITSRNQIWILTFNSEIIVLEKEAEDVYRQKTFVVKNQSETLINKSNCLREDHEGNIWVGTFNGPVIYYSPWNIFNIGDVTGTQIPISRNDGTNVVDYLLNSESIYDIAIDGGNRKWMATLNSGVFLVSPDGKETILNYKSENSPLLSNIVTGIGINEKTGEVFFATDVGLVSHGGTAIKGFDKYTDVYVYPNPVRREYTGPITITGLIENSVVKITDINGLLVWETQSLGGQAIWDGKNFDGRKVATGVYLIMLATEDGSESHITKLLFLH